MPASRAEELLCSQHWPVGAAHPLACTEHSIKAQRGSVKPVRSVCTYHASLNLGARCWSAVLKVLQIKENIHAGAFQVGFFTPGETKWRLRNVASSASRLHVRGSSRGFPRAAQLSHIRPTVTPWWPAGDLQLLNNFHFLTITELQISHTNSAV